MEYLKQCHLRVNLYGRKYHRKQRTDFKVKLILGIGNSSPCKTSKITVGSDVTYFILLDRYQCSVKTWCQTAWCPIQEDDNFQDMPNFISINYQVLC
jgi:hypothetical protein